LKEAEQRKFPADLLDTVIQRSGSTVLPDDGQSTGQPQLPYKQPALDRTLLAQIHGWLEILNKTSLYELLDLPARTPAISLTANARLLHARWSRMLPKTSECVAWEKTLQACLTYLKDDLEKA